MAKKIMFAVNLTIIMANFILNYFYQVNGFGFELKFACSGIFVLLAIINLIYAISAKQPNLKFYISMSIGIVFAFLGDVLIIQDFIVGALAFALGHICFFITYCFIGKVKSLDLVIGGAFSIGCAVFLLFCPLLEFDIPILRYLCVAYGVIISLMLGKAIGNFTRNKRLYSLVIVAASGLFFFSDLMLVFGGFMGLGSWTNNACMGTYYPALCLLAFSMFLKTLYKKV